MHPEGHTLAHRSLECPVDHGAPGVTMKNVGRARPRIFVIQHVAALLGLVS